jgi:hypothetical protein
MEYVKAEIARLWDAAHSGVPHRNQLLAAQQALSWALDPERFRAPFLYVMGIPEGSPDCPSECRQDTFQGSSVPTQDAA